MFFECIDIYVDGHQATRIWKMSLDETDEDYHEFELYNGGGIRHPHDDLS